MPPRLTWASAGLFRAEMFGGVKVGQSMRLRPLLEASLAERRLGAQRWHGRWVDVGTPERLREADAATVAER